MEGTKSSTVGSHSVHGNDLDCFDEFGQQHRLDSGDHALIPPPSDRRLHILLAILLIGSVALFGASLYAMFGDDDDDDTAEMLASDVPLCAQLAPCTITRPDGKTFRFELIKPDMPR